MVKITRSPTTNSLAETIFSDPFLITVAVGALIVFRAAREAWAFFSWIIPIIELITTMKKITPASTHSFKRAEKVAAPNKIKIIGSKICSLSMFKIDLGGFSFKTLCPYFFNRLSTSGSLKPAELVSRFENNSSFV